MGQLDRLQHLDLRYDQLSGTIPYEIGELPDLTHIYLAGNKLTGTIPHSLGLSQQRLVHVDFGRNRLSGEIPHSLISNRTIKRLILFENNLTGQIPRAFSSRSNLERLDLRYNYLTGPIPSEIGTTPDLRYLFLSNNQLSGSIPERWNNWHDLTELRLENNRLTGEIPVSLTELRWLDLLVLDNNQLTGAVPAGLSRLGHLGIVDNNFTGCIPEALRDMLIGNLEYANIVFCGDPPRTTPVTPDFIEWAFDNTVTPSQELAARLGVQWLNSFLEKLGWPVPQDKITVHVGSYDNLIRAWSDRVEDCDIECAKNYWRYTSSAVRSGNAFSATFPTTYGLDYQVESITRETLHAIRLSWLDDRSFTWEQTIPDWWNQGFAQLIERLANAEGRGIEFRLNRNEYIGRSLDLEPTLPMLERSLDTEALYRGALAIELLASQVGLRKLIDFYNDPTSDASWQQRFKRIFNLSVPDFYALYEEHRLDAFPPLDVPLTTWRAR